MSPPPPDLPVAEARARIGAAIAPLTDTESVVLEAALGRILADDLISPIDVPAHDNSAMDGYALPATGLTGPHRYRVVGKALAGQPWSGSLAADECIRIMTGAVMPAACGAVIPQELVQVTGDHIALTVHAGPDHGPAAAPRVGQNVRRRGEDLQAGKPALGAGRLLRPADLGLIASLGIAHLTVRRRPRVAFFSSGSELRAPGAALGPGAIYDSNRASLRGLLTRLGVELIDLGLVADDPTRLEAVLRAAATRADAIVTSGGVSVGEADFTRALLARLGQVDFWSIAMKPGRPFAFGRIGGAHLFGLPGNPVAAMVAFCVLVRPALLQLAGSREAELPLLRATCASTIRKQPGRTEFLRGVLEAGTGGCQVRVTGAQGSGILSSVSAANCLIVLPAERSNVAPGEVVDFWVFDGLM